MIRRWLSTRANRDARRNQLLYVGLTRADIDHLKDSGLDPLGDDHEAVTLSAQVGTRTDQIPGHVNAVRRVTDRDPHITEAKALELIARLHTWGIPHGVAGGLVIHIARATRGA